MRLERQRRLEHALDKRISSLSVVLEALYLRHNLSAVLRTAEAFGIQDVHLVSSGKPVEHGVARGAEKWITLHLHETIDDCIAALKEDGFSVYVADLAPGAYTPQSLPIDRNTAVLFGTELHGVSQRAKELADGAIVIPMYGLTQSLNVSVAAACILSQLADRRRCLVGEGDLSPGRKAQILQTWRSRHN